MNASTTIGFGTDATLLATAAQSVNERIGKFDLVVSVPDNLTGSAINYGTLPTGSLYLRIKAHDGLTAPSGYYDIAGPFSVVRGGTLTVPMYVLSKKIGFFGSGNVKANIELVLHDKSALQGGDIAFIAGPRTGWGFQDAENVAAFRSPGYPPLNTSY